MTTGVVSFKMLQTAVDLCTMEMQMAMWAPKICSGCLLNMDWIATSENAVRELFNAFHERLWSFRG
jgi:hypothetical protein